MPIRDDHPSQYQRAQESGVVFDLTGWTILRLAGRDSVTFLNNFCTNELKALPPGEGLEAFVTNVKARVISHVLVFADPDPASGLTLLAGPGQAEPLATHLDRYVIREDVTIRDETAESGLLCVAGQGAAHRMTAAGIQLPEAPSRPAIGRFASGTVLFGDASCKMLRADLLGLPCYLVAGTHRDIAITIEQLDAAGLSLAEAAVFNALRIEAVYPLSGIDAGEEQLAPEVDRPWAISYTKGCYLGQEPIARIDALGHVNRLLRGLRIESGPVPERGSSILAEGKEIGSITSSALSFADGRPVAMGYLRAKFAEPGSSVSVQTPSGELPAVVFAGTPPGPSTPPAA